MKIIVITQARCGSTRLPNKVLKQINGETLLGIHLKRILRSRKINLLIVATTTDQADDAIIEIANKAGTTSYRGSINNVLDRFYQAAKPYHPDWVVRLTSDCPLIDPDLMDAIIDKTLELDVDYCSNSLNPTYPDGMDVEVFKYSALEKAWNEATLDSEKEHVTPYIHKNSSFNNKDLFTSYNFANNVNYENVRLTVDEQKDFDVVSGLILKLGTNEGWKTYADYYLQDNIIKNLNSDIERNEGYIKSIQKD
jgi:spore coat polysaccharide biosynthesis protein SpsF